MRRDPDNLTGRYILGPDNEPLACPDLLKWAHWMEENPDRHVAEDDLGDVWVSTVFLGLDHQFGEGPPLLFETMTFKRGGDGQLDMGGDEQFRYSTWDDAWAGHAALVKRLKEKRPAGAPVSPEGAEQEQSSEPSDPS